MCSSIRNINNLQKIELLSPSRKKAFALDFFAGSGLAAEALSSYFDIIWANDISAKKAATFLANHPGNIFHLMDIADINAADLPPAFLSWASFPCQDLSLAGKMNGIESPRSGLVWQWLRVMDEMHERPPVVVAENVLGLVSANKGEHYLALHGALRKRGYKVGAVLLDAKYWLPQSRPRVFVIGVLETIDTTSFEAKGPIWCHNSAIKRVALTAESFVWWSLPQPKAKPKSLSEIVDFNAPVHDSTRTKGNLSLIAASHRERLKAELDGIPMVFPGYKRIRNGKQVLELRFDNIAGCLRTPEGGSSRQLLVIYRDGELSTRLLTVRETARLMGVRDSYKIEGSYNDGYKAMGDAVAVPVVRHLAKYLLAPLAQGRGL